MYTARGSEWISTPEFVIITKKGNPLLLNITQIVHARTDADGWIEIKMVDGTCHRFPGSLSEIFPFLHDPKNQRSL